MDTYTPEYSLKNIPYPSHHAFQLALTEKIEDFIKRLRWRTLFYLEPQEDNNCTKKEVYNLKSQNTPPTNRLLDPFEADLFRLIKKVKFKRGNNNFQMKFSRDIKELKSSKCIWLRADKSRNMYKVEPSKYQEILNNKITDDYKIDKDNTIDQINKDTCNFSRKLHINDRLGKFQKKDAYILFKDHKPNFINKLQTSLINLSKTGLGKKF